MSCDWVRRLFRCPFLSRSKLSLLAHSHICKKSVPNTTALTTIDNWHAHMSYEIEPKQPFLLLVYSHVSSKKTEINVTLLHFKCEIEPLVKWTGDSYFPNGIEPVFKWWSTIRVVVAPPAAANPIARSCTSRCHGFNWDMVLCVHIFSFQFPPYETSWREGTSHCVDSHV